jgi:bisphosphoglycerate-independent phosphoglycerate mutase (AlkP superfamily)
MPTAIAVTDGSRLPVLPASTAEAVDFEPVAGREESMIGGHALEPALQAAVEDFDDAVAPRADEVMVVVFPAAAVGTGTVHVFENDTGRDDANHALEGLYILAAAGICGGRRAGPHLRDVAPTVLELLGESVPAEMEGHSLAPRPTLVGSA